MREQGQSEGKSLWNELGATFAWPGYLADPMVLRTSNGYYAYGTDGPDGFARETSMREFPVLRSIDLVEWQFIGGALEIPSDMEVLAFWAPEVAEKDGRFYLYYSAGGPEGEGHQVRVATSTQPEGPFIDQGQVIQRELFTIDAHPFQDPVDGQRYLFFAKDFLEEPVGTGIAVGKLSEDLMSVEGPIVPLLRGFAKWQIFEKNRFWYGKDWETWYCVEGPFVVHRLGRYWMFYSGGNWHASDYGVSCAVADKVTGPYRDADSLDGPAVLRSGPELHGPGHCSIVTSPDHVDHICFHAWNADYTARTMRIAPLAWESNRPRLAK